MSPEGIPFEKGPEKILTKDEVLATISHFAENVSFVRELSDEHGLYLLEVKAEGENAGETIQYEYMRKGEFPNNNRSSATTIHIVYYQDGRPYGGHNVADYNYETGEWVEVK